MGSGNKMFERLFKLQTSVNQMVMGNVRDPEDVARYLQRIINDPGFVSVLDGSGEINILNPSDSWFSEWERFYQENYGFKPKSTPVCIGEKPGFGWEVVVAKGLTLNEAWARCQKMFPSYSCYGDNLDKAVPESDRMATSTYIKRFRNRSEADEELKNLSANILMERRIQGITLLERFLLEQWYYWRTLSHLDTKNVTLCAGSRDGDNTTPCACWSRKKKVFWIYNCDPNKSLEYLRARAAL